MCRYIDRKEIKLGSIQGQIIGSEKWGIGENWYRVDRGLENAMGLCKFLKIHLCFLSH